VDGAITVRKTPAKVAIIATVATEVVIAPRDTRMMRKANIKKSSSSTIRDPG
jgi:hypothetical protein